MIKFIEIEDVDKRDMIVNLDSINYLLKREQGDYHLLFLNALEFGIKINSDTFNWIRDYLMSNDLLE